MSIKPSVVLVRPQLPENIGLVARAMDNCGLEKLILVSPREKWPNKLAIQSAANSKKIILSAKLFYSLDEALSNFHYVIATSNRKRLLQKPSQNEFSQLFKDMPKMKKSALVFGPENSGLTNKDLMLADIIFTINLSKSNTSLNLSHAVLLFSYKWKEFSKLVDNKKINKTLNTNLSLKKDFRYFMQYLKNELINVGFLLPKDKNKNKFDNIQAMFLRSSLNKNEIQTLWGMIKKLRR